MAVTDVIKRLGELLQPLAAAPVERRERVLEKARLVRISSGKPLFQEGERDSDSVYLVKGSIDTFSGGQRLKRLDAGTPAAVWPLPDDQPRRVTARATTDVGLLLVPRALLRPLLDGDADSDGVEVRDIDDSGETGDWMTLLLRSPLYSQLPASNIQRIMAMMESVIVRPGDTLVRQGEIGDYFYFLSRGRARVVRQARDGEPPVLLAELKEGVSFGEEALVAGIPRNATVTMTTEGLVMRLSKEHFETLILEPTLKRLAWVDAEVMLREGAQWIDVRFPDEFEKDGLEGAVNIPLGMLRMRMPRLDTARRYVVYCDNGQRSAAGAFLLAGAGFDVYMLDGGITTPEEIDTMDTDLEPPPAPQTPFGSDTGAGTETEEAPEEIAEAVDMSQYLRATIDALKADKATTESRVMEMQAELSATREALKAERVRGRELVRELQALRQTLTDLQREAQAALQRERSAHEQALSKAVESLEQTLADKEAEVEVVRAQSEAEIARLKRLLDPPPLKSAG